MFVKILLVAFVLVAVGNAVYAEDDGTSSESGQQAEVGPADSRFVLVPQQRVVRLARYVNPNLPSPPLDPYPTPAPPSRPKVAYPGIRRAAAARKYAVDRTTTRRPPTLGPRGYDIPVAA